MNQSVNPFLHLDEGAEIGDVPDLSGDDGSRSIAGFNDIPRIRLGLFQSQGDAPGFDIDIQNDSFDGDRPR